MFKRPHFQLLKRRLKEPRKFIQVILGLRQIGKTTLINQLLKEIKIPFHYVSADGVAAVGGIWIEQQWEIARAIKKQNGAKEVILIIDEVQKIPGNKSCRSFLN